MLEYKKRFQGVDKARLNKKKNWLSFDRLNSIDLLNSSLIEIPTEKY